MHEVGHDIGRIREEKQPRDKANRGEQERALPLVEHLGGSREEDGHPCKEEVPAEEGECALARPDVAQGDQADAIGGENGQDTQLACRLMGERDAHRAVKNMKHGIPVGGVPALRRSGGGGCKEN